MRQAELLGPAGIDPAPPYVKNSDTSKAAAKAMLGKTGSVRRRIYLRIKLAGAYGCTDEQIQVAEGIDPSTERPRRVELVQAGLIRDSGRRRDLKSGRTAVVWIAT